MSILTAVKPNLPAYNYKLTCIQAVALFCVIVAVVVVVKERHLKLMINRVGVKNHLLFEFLS